MLLQCSDPVHVSNDKKKQDITIADLSDVSKITLWEENIGKVQAGMAYNFHNFMVREYASTKFLSMAKDGSKIEPISDIGEVKQCKDGNDKEETTFIKCFDSYSSTLGLLQVLFTLQSQGRAFVASTCKVLKTRLYDAPEI